MWIMTKYGFFSITKTDQKVALKAIGPSLPYVVDVMRFRARDKNHLWNLQERFSLQEYEIIETKLADYRWRMLLPRPHAAVVLGSLLNDIDYDNFKNAAKKEHPKDGNYLAFLVNVWRLGVDMLQGSKRR